VGALFGGGGPKGSQKTQKVCPPGPPPRLKKNWAEIFWKLQKVVGCLFAQLGPAKKACFKIGFLFLAGGFFENKNGVLKKKKNKTPNCFGKPNRRGLLFFLKRGGGGGFRKSRGANFFYLLNIRGFFFWGGGKPLVNFLAPPF